MNSIGYPLKTEDAAAVSFVVEVVRAMAAGNSVGHSFDVALEEICASPTAEGVFLVPALTNDYREIVLRLEAVERMAMETRDLLRLLLDHAGIDQERARPGA